MKKDVSIPIAIAILVMVFTSCQKNQDSPELTQTNVAFTFSASQVKSASSQGLTDIVVTVEDLQGNAVLESKKIPIYKMGANYVSGEVALVVGEYKLSKFLVVSSNNNVVYAAPKEGSDKASLVNKPLPLLFSANKNSAVQVAPEVTSVSDSSPEEFGYASFSFIIADSFDFLAGASVFNDTSKTYELTNASISIYNDTTLVHSGQLQPGSGNGTYDSLSVTNKITLPEKYNDFKIVISKPGYVSFDSLITKEELRLHYRAEDKGPLVVVLKKDTTTQPAYLAAFEVYPQVQTWPMSTVQIENFSVKDADSYDFDFGDGNTVNAQSFVSSYSHTYAQPGTYTIKLSVQKAGYLDTAYHVVYINDSVAVSAGPDTTVYVDTVYMNATMPANSSGEWTIVDGIGTFTNLNDPNTMVTNLGVGTNTFKWTVTTSDNQIIEDDVNITYTSFAVNAGMDQVITSDTAHLSAVLPAGGTGQWSIVDGTGNFDDATSPQTKVTGISYGEHTYRWTVEINGVIKSDDIIITRN